MESDFAGASHLSADHPLLQQAQEALTFQLEERKLYLHEQLREKVQGLKVGQLAIKAAGTNALNEGDVHSILAQY
jgi:hypothetical protein